MHLFHIFIWLCVLHQPQHPVCGGGGDIVLFLLFFQQADFISGFGLWFESGWNLDEG